MRQRRQVEIDVENVDARGLFVQTGHSSLERKRERKKTWKR